MEGSKGGSRVGLVVSKVGESYKRVNMGMR
jgi:hypothetical protein